MHLDAESVKVNTDEDGISLEVFGYANTPDADEVTLTINIQGIDLDQFYSHVQTGVGGYLREKGAVHQEFLASVQRQHGAFVCSPEDVDESGGYALSDPKHPDFHSIHADIWDARDGK